MINGTGAQGNQTGLWGGEGGGQGNEPPAQEVEQMAISALCSRESSNERKKETSPGTAEQSGLGKRRREKTIERSTRAIPAEKKKDSAWRDIMLEIISPRRIKGGGKGRL